MRQGYLLLMLCWLLSACTSKQVNKSGENMRIVALGQSAVELLIEFGLADRIIGVAYLDKPDVVAAYPNIPILSSGWTDKETLLQLQPDLIFAMEAAFRADRIGNSSFWEERGVATFQVDSYQEDKCFDAFYADVFATGRLFGLVDKANEIVEELHHLRERYAIDLAKISVLHLSHISGTQFYYYPPEMCLLDEVLEDMGGEYIYLGDRSFILSVETILSLNPDKIIITQFRKGGDEGVLNLLQQHPLLRRLKAVEQHKILDVDYSKAIRGDFEMEELYMSIYKFLKQ